MIFKKFFPNKVLSLNSSTINSLVALLIIVVIIGTVYALFISPPDYIQGDSVRIMYVHVPSSFISLSCFGIMGIASICNLIFKIKFMPFLAKSLATLGCVFTLISIVTGSLWGKPTWGTWWVWDARLTSMMVLMFFYISYILCFKFIKKEQLMLKVSSLIAILGAINLPIIKYSVDWWTTLHQPASIKLGVSNSIHSTMMLPLLSMLLVLVLYGALIFLMKYKTEIIRIKKKSIKRL